MCKRKGISSLLDFDEIKDIVMPKKKITTIKLTATEISGDFTRQQWAEALISKLQKKHDGRNLWLLNYGEKEEAQALRGKKGLKFKEDTNACETFGDEKTPDGSKGLNNTQKQLIGISLLKAGIAGTRIETLIQSMRRDYKDCATESLYDKIEGIIELVTKDRSIHDVKPDPKYMNGTITIDGKLFEVKNGLIIEGFDNCIDWQDEIPLTSPKSHVYHGKAMLDCPLGLYRIMWTPKDGGKSSLAGVGYTASGRRWFKPTNWTGGEVSYLDEHLESIESIILLERNKY